MAPKIWSKIPEKIKVSSSLEKRMRLSPLSICLQHVAFVNYIDTVIDLAIQIAQYSS